MNFTLDDTASQLVYSTGGWASQAPSDPNLSRFFLGTYHAVQTNGATLNMSVAGSAIAIYGTKGPGHGNYSVQIDSSIAYLSANAPETQYQQVLFSHEFDPTIPSPHFVSFKAILGDGAEWLDIDFVTTTSSNSTSPDAVTALPNTLSPPWLTSSSSSPSPTSTGVAAAGAVGDSGPHSSHAKLNIAAEVLAILFGCIIGITALVVVGYVLLRRRYDRQRAQEHNFRMGLKGAGGGGPGGAHGGSEPKRFVIGAPTNFQHKESGGTAPFAVSQQHLLSHISFNGSASSLGHARTLSHTRTGSAPSSAAAYATRGLPDPPPSPGLGSLASSMTLSASSTSGGSTASKTSDTKALITLPAASPAPAPSVHSRSSGKPFAFLSTAPSSFSLGLKRMSKGDADSMKTDFLQV